MDASAETAQKEKEMKRLRGPNKQGKHCIVCGMLIPAQRFCNSFGTTRFCDHTCKKAHEAGRTREEQFRYELENGLDDWTPAT